MTRTVIACVTLVIALALFLAGMQTAPIITLILGFAIDLWGSRSNVRSGTKK